MKITDIIKLIVYEFIFGYAIQSAAYVINAYAFSKRKIEKKQFIVTTLVVTAVAFLARSLPLNFGVHTIITLIALIMVCVLYNKMSVIRVISSSIITTIILLCGEGLTFALCTAIFGETTLRIYLSNDITKALLAIPMGIIMIASALLMYFLLTRKKNIADNGDN